MSEEELRMKILEKIDLALNSMGASHNIDFNEKASCVVCNLASAYENLKGKQE